MSHLSPSRGKVSSFHVRLLADRSSATSLQFVTTPDSIGGDFLLASVSITCDSAVALLVDERNPQWAQHGPSLSAAAETIISVWAETLGVVLLCDAGKIDWVTLDSQGNYHAVVPVERDGRAPEAALVPLQSLAGFTHKHGSLLHEVYPEAAGLLTWRLAQLALATGGQEAHPRRSNAHLTRRSSMRT